jgi:hypothetical protein
VARGPAAGASAVVRIALFSAAAVPSYILFTLV